MRNAMWVGGGITGMGGIPMLGTGARGLTTLVRGIFRNGEQGFAYDPNDLTTLYQDAAGIIPVTAARQPVGLMLDKSKGLVFGAELITNNDFSNNGVGWIIGGGVPTYKGGVITLTSQAGAIGEIYQDISVPVGRWVKITARAKYSDALSFNINVYDGGGYTNVKGAIIFGTSFEEKSGYFFSTTGSLRVRMRLGTSTVAGTGDVDYISVKEIAGNHAYQTNAASRPILRQNVTTGAYYLEFDGTDDFLQTNSIDFTATDKVSLFAGVRKLSNAATGLVTELGTQTETTRQGFALFAPGNNGTNNYNFRSYGTTGDATGTTLITQFPAPHSAVLTAKGQISTDLCSLTVNRAVTVAAIMDQGTGNYGNYPLYIGRRAGTSLPFNGHLYNLIGIGRLTTDSETIALEKSIAKNTGVTL